MPRFYAGLKPTRLDCVALEDRTVPTYYGNQLFPLDNPWNQVVANAPVATRACKRLVRDVAGREISAELRADTASRIADIRVSEEGKEGIQSFLDKRKPAWQNP